MKTPKKLADSAFTLQTWTKLTLEELIMCGRVLRSDDKTLMDFVTVANGHPKSVESLKNYQIAVQIIKTQ